MSDPKPGGTPKSGDLFLTSEAYAYLMGKDPTGKRHSMATYQRMDRLKAIYENLKLAASDGKTEPISLDELKMLVYEDSKVVECAHCKATFQPVAAVDLVSLEHPETNERYKAKQIAGIGADPEHYGRFAPYIMTMEVEDQVVPRVSGNFLPILGKDGGEALPFCGSFWWYNKVTAVTNPNWQSHIFWARDAQAQRLNKPVWKVQGCSSLSVVQVLAKIEAVTEKRQAERSEQREKEAKERGSLADLLNAKAGNRQAKSDMRGGRRDGKDFRRRV